MPSDDVYLYNYLFYVMLFIRRLKMQKNIVKKSKRTSMPFYLQTWFIAFLFFFGVYVIPLIVGIVLIYKQHRYFAELKPSILEDAEAEKDSLQREINKLVKERDAEKAKIMSELKFQAKQLRDEIDFLKSERDAATEKILTELEVENGELLEEVSEKRQEVESLSAEIDNLQLAFDTRSKELFDLDEKLMYQDFGLYAPKYSCVSSDEYKERIDNVRKKQKKMISDRKALRYSDEWVLDGSAAKGRAMNNDNMKMVLLAFNGECDSIIRKVKFNNVERIEDRIVKIAEKINKLNERNKISITKAYMNLKLEELHLVYEYELKKQEEKEEIRRIREEEREAQKVAKELEAARKNIDKEHSHYSNALENAKLQLQTASDDEKQALQEKVDELENKLSEIQTSIEELDYREANMKAGYVYIISNIGSFGENVYKIGMTRRLEPMDRINELGDASVPFKFDVHAMIFSDDAPKLEAALHNAFETKKVNMVNGRKEFFHVSLEEIEKVVKENYEKTVEFNRNTDAEEFRETQMMLKKIVHVI